MAFQDIKHKTVRCTECSEQILRNRELVLNNKTICLGCATEKGITRVHSMDINHKLNCFKKAGTGPNDCHYCFVVTWGTMKKLGYECTNAGSWFKRTNNEKVLVIYE